MTYIYLRQFFDYNDSGLPLITTSCNKLRKTRLTTQSR